MVELFTFRALLGSLGLSWAFLGEWLKRWFSLVI